MAIQVSFGWTFTFQLVTGFSQSPSRLASGGPPWLNKPQAAEGEGISPESLSCQPFMGNSHLLRIKVSTQKMSQPKWVDANTINKRNKSHSSTCFFFSFSFLLEFHVLLDFVFHILGSIIIGYWSARIIQFILTDLFSNTLTSIVLCISMVYLTFYIGKAEPRTKSAVLSANFIHLLFFP